MAACTLGGTITVKVVTPYLNVKESVSTSPSLNKYGCLKAFERIRIPSIRHKQASYSCTFGKPHRNSSPFAINCSSAQAESKPGDISEEKNSLTLANQLVPSSQVESLLTSICDTTSIAEFKLNLGGFHLYVKRDLGGNDLDYIASITPPVYTETPSLSPDSNGSVNSTSLVLSKPESSAGGLQGFLNAAHDEGLVMLQSPKVGVFRRSRTIKGKRAPPSCKEKQEVKEGQVICFIEQLGGEIPIESDVSGEVVKILREDGEPVGYGDALIAILPSFPGIKKLQLPA